MSTYSNQTEFDVMKKWLEEKENNGVLQALEEKYNTCYYDALRKKDATNIVLRNVTSEKVVRYSR